MHYTPYFIISLCLTPEDFTRQGKSAATQWVNQTIFQCILLPISLSGNELCGILLYHFILSNAL